MGIEPFEPKNISLRYGNTGARVLQKISAFAEICKNIASLSYDTKYKVGTIVFDNDFRSILSTGYNGNYAGGPNERDSMASGSSGFIHSELNALFKLDGRPNADHVLMCTMTPCWHCAKCIANSGIKRAVFLTNYSKDRKFEEIFSNSGISWAVLDADDDEKIISVIK